VEQRLTITDRPADWIDDTDLPPLAMGAGLPSICVVREHNDTEASVCGYLVDTYCQGVKNAVPPSIVDRRDLPAFVADFFAAYNTGPLAAPITLAQDLILGAVDYAATLGFDPHPRLLPRQTHPRRLAATQPHPIRTPRAALLPARPPTPTPEPHPCAHLEQIGRGPLATTDAPPRTSPPAAIPR
jgi:hypothetical protein